MARLTRASSRKNDLDASCSSEQEDGFAALVRLFWMHPSMCSLTRTFQEYLKQASRKAKLVEQENRALREEVDTLKVKLDANASVRTTRGKRSGNLAQEVARLEGKVQELEEVCSSIHCAPYNLPGIVEGPNGLSMPGQQEVQEEVAQGAPRVLLYPQVSEYPCTVKLREQELRHEADDLLDGSEVELENSAPEMRKVSTQIECIVVGHI